MFQILKHTVSAMMCDVISIIEDMSQLIIAGFETQPCPVGLDCIKLVSEYDFLVVSFDIQKQ